MKHNATQKGFTLLEIIAVLLIVGLLTAVAGLGVVQIARGFVITQASGEIALKSDFVLTRLRKSIRNLTGVTAASGSTLTMTRIANDGTPITESFQYTNSTLQLTTNEGGNNASATLMEGVGGLAFSYFDEAGDSWDISSNDLGDLAAVRVSIGMQGPENSTLNFTEEILPRNTYTPSRGYTPSEIGSTSAQGLCLLKALYPDTPLVWRLFRDFRDNRLSGVPFGQSLITVYYRTGIAVNGVISAHPEVRRVAGWAAAPLVSLLFFWHYFPAGLIALFAAAWIMGRLAARLLVRAPGVLCIAGRQVRMAGSILLSLVVTMTILALLGGALISILNSAQGTGAATVLGDQAYYFSESGLRYALSQFMDNQDDDSAFINALTGDGTDGRFDVTESGGFELNAQCFYFDPVDANTLQSFGEDFPSEIFDTVVPGVSSGRLQFVNADGNGTVVSVLINGKNDGTENDTITHSGWAGAATAEYAFPVARVDGNQMNITAADFGSDVNTDTISLLSSGFVNFFPNVRGLVSFMADADNDGSYDDEVFLIYEERVGNVLSKLRNVPGKDPLPTGGIDILDETPVVLGRYAKLKSTGVAAAETNMESRAELTLHQPLDVAEFMKMIYNTEAAEQHVESLLGDHEMNAQEGALQVTETEDTYFAVEGVDVSVQESLAAYDWDAAGWNDGEDNFLRNLWERSDRKLSYEAQVKVKFTEAEDDAGDNDRAPFNHPGHYMPGLAFRLKTPGDPAGATFYGMSFVRGLQGTSVTSSGCGGPTTASDDDDVPDSLYAGNGLNESNISSQCEDSEFTPTEWNDDAMLDGIPYLLFWQKYIEDDDGGCGAPANNSPFEWLSYMPLVTAEKTTIHRYEDDAGVSVYGNVGILGNFSDRQADFSVDEYTLSECQALGMGNDDIEGVEVQPGFRVTLYEHDNFAGESLVLTEGDHILRNYYCADCGGDWIFGDSDTDWADDVSSLIVEYVGSDLRLGWYDGPLDGFSADETYDAWKLTDAYHLFQTYPYEDNEDIQTLGLPGAVTVMDPDTVDDEGGPLPVQNTAYVVFPGDTGDADQAYKRDLNYRLYLKEWVTVGFQIFELEGDLDCNENTGDANGEERVNAVSAFFAAPDDSPDPGGGTDAADDIKDGYRSAYNASTQGNYDNYPVQWLEDRDYFTKAVWNGLGINGSDEPVFPTDGGYTSMMVPNPYPTGGCAGNADEIKVVEKGRDVDGDPTIVYTGAFVTTDYATYFDDPGISVPEIGLHTLGVSAEASADEEDRETAYFKDWYWRFFEGGQTGMIPGVISE